MIVSNNSRNCHLCAEVLGTLAKHKGEICNKCKPTIAAKVRGGHSQKSDIVTSQIDWRKCNNRELQQYQKVHILKVSESQHPNEANLGVRTM